MGSDRVNLVDLFGSGGHVWVWSERPRSRKVLRSTGLSGAASMLLAVGERPLVIGGKHGSPALLKATGANRAASDAALDALETAIEAYCNAGAAYSWTDDQGHTGTALELRRYERVGGREYGPAGTVVWQRYRVHAVELNGDPR